jgi:hypothetical protein
MDLVREVGADEVIDYTVADYTRDGPRYDWILDIAGNHSLLECRRALKPRGVYVLVGGPTSRILAALVLGPVISLAGNRKLGLQMGWKPFKQEDVATLRELTRPEDRRSSTDGTGADAGSRGAAVSSRAARRGGRSSSPSDGRSTLPLGLGDHLIVRRCRLAERRREKPGAPQKDP